MNSNPRLDLDSLRVLSTIVAEGSFVRAANALHRVPSTISYAVSKLEQSTGIRLFEREGHKVRLTEAGQEVYRHAQELLRVAAEAETAIGHLATGWESQLRLAVHDFFPEDKLMPLVEEFYAVARATRLSISTEVMTGIWDALLGERADIILAIGSDGPEGGGYGQAEIGQVEFVFVVAPHHPLAAWQGPVPEDELRRHRAVAIADTSRQLPVRSLSLLPGQPVLTVSTPQMKLQAHLQGIGVGTLPRAMVQPYLDDGRLLEKELEGRDPQRFPLVCAWRNKRKGLALQWLRERLTDPARPVQWLD
ncbi:LysR family transcriptional regulator [Granulosicoccaceae sp. 1_MG-2023]|nr:LysR family transcriptional regulator [Granulosicoccaceae sp. 1_MG-2023]